MTTSTKLKRAAKAFTDRLRMLAWLILGMLFYIASIGVGPDTPILQTVLYKVGHVTTLAWVGYWISRNALGRIEHQNFQTADHAHRVARAIVIGAVIIAGSLGL